MSKLEDEIDCLLNIVECLTAAFQRFNQFEHLRNEGIKEIKPLINQTMECFKLSTTFLASDSDPLRIKCIVFENCIEFIPILLKFITIPISEELNKKNTQILLRIRIEAMRTLTQFISLCSAELELEKSMNRSFSNISEVSNSVVDEEENDQDQEEVAKMCAEVIVENQGLDVLFSLLNNEQYDTMRLAVAECMFVFVVRNKTGKLAVVLQRGIRQVLDCLNTEGNSQIRNYLCALLREYATVYPEELLKENMLEVASKLINIDPSPDVRALCAEILENLFKADERTLRLLREDSELPQILSARLLKDQNREVLEATCKLLETLFCLQKQSFIERFIAVGGWASFIRVLKQSTVRPASLAVRALRYLIQYADHNLLLGYKIITHFPSLSVLLKSVIKLEKSSKNTIAHKLLKVELSICLGVIFAKNPACRFHVRKELVSFPLWMATLRSALLKHLSLAELEYFSDITLVDDSGVDLIRIFNNDSMQGPAIKRMFETQEQRFQSNLEQVPPATSFDNDYQFNSSLSDHLSSDTSWGKIKSFIIIYSIHQTLSTPEGSQVSPSKSEMSVASEVHTDISFHTTGRNDHMGMFTQPDGIEAEDAYGRRQANLSRSPSQVGSPHVDGARTASTKPPTSYTYDTPKRRLKKHTKKKKIKKKKTNLQALRLDQGMHLFKMFGKYFVDNVETRRSSNAKPSSPYNTKFYKQYIATQNQIGRETNMKLRQYRPQPSPSTLQKWWDDKCVQFSDFFFFEIPLEDFRLDLCYDILKACKKHHKGIKRKFVTCPTSRNGYGRRVFLMDMNTVIMNHIYSLIEEFSQLIEDHGVETIRVTVYLWRGNDKSITSVHNKNICDVLTFVKDHLAKASNLPTQSDENEHAQQIREALEEKKLSEDIQLLHGQDNITMNDLHRIESLESRIQEIKERHKKQEQAKQRAAIASAAADAATDVYYNTQMQLYSQPSFETTSTKPVESALSQQADQVLEEVEANYAPAGSKVDEEMLSAAERIQIRKDQLRKNRETAATPESPLNSSSGPIPKQNVPQPTPPSNQKEEGPVTPNEDFSKEDIVSPGTQESISPIKPITQSKEASPTTTSSNTAIQNEKSVVDESPSVKEEKPAGTPAPVKTIPIQQKEKVPVKEEKNPVKEEDEAPKSIDTSQSTPMKMSPSQVETPPPAMPNPETPPPMIKDEDEDNSNTKAISARERLAQRRKQRDDTPPPTKEQHSTPSPSTDLNEVDESKLSSLERIRLRRERRRQSTPVESNNESGEGTPDRLSHIKARLAARRAKEQDS